MNAASHFPIMVAASLVEFLALLLLVLGREVFRRRIVPVSVVAVVVVVVGMFLGKYGVQLGLPWWVYYPVPALVTMLLPPLVFRMATKRTLLYIVLAAISAPLIHVLFGLLLGWNEYMPFIPVPSLADLIGPVR